MCTDPIVKAVRDARERIAAECGYDLHKMLRRQQEVMRRWKGKVADAEDLVKGQEGDKPVPRKRASPR